MYKPKAKRRWGYYALPILHGAELVGKVDAQSDFERGELRVDGVHEDVPFSAAIRAGLQAELEDLARWLRIELVEISPL
jgi:uncharacterized protein YcaQ